MKALSLLILNRSLACRVLDSIRIYLINMQQIKNMIEKQQKRGRGRPKGGKSFTNLTMSQLKDFIGEHQCIPVSRVWLESMNIEVVDTKRVIQAQPSATTSPTVTMKLSD